MMVCGMMGHEHLRNIALLQGTQVAAIFEPDPEMARTACALTPGALLVGLIAEFLAVEALDSLVITSPNFRHLEQLEEIAATRPLPWMRGCPPPTRCRWAIARLWWQSGRRFSARLRRGKRWKLPRIHGKGRGSSAAGAL